MMMTSRMIDRMMMISSCPSIYTHWNIHTNFSSDPPIADFTLSKIAWHWHLEFTCKEIYIKHIYLIHFILTSTFKTCIKNSLRHVPFISVQYVKIWILKLNTWFCWLSLASKKSSNFGKDLFSFQLTSRIPQGIQRIKTHIGCLSFIPSLTVFICYLNLRDRHSVAKNENNVWIQNATLHLFASLHLWMFISFSRRSFQKVSSALSIVQ